MKGQRPPTDRAYLAAIAIAIIAPYARAEDRLLAFQSGYQVHLSKPVEPTRLVEAIVRLVRSGAEQG